MATKRTHENSGADTNKTRIRVLLRQLKKKLKKIQKLEQERYEREKSNSLELAFLQQKLKIKTNKIVKLKRKLTKQKQLTRANEKLRKVTADQQAELDDLKHKNNFDANGKLAKSSNKPSTSRDNRNELMPENLTHRVLNVLHEFEMRQNDAPSSLVSAF